MDTIQNIINNESCDSTYTPNLGKFTSTNTIHENIKIYYHNEEVVNITEKEGLLHLKPQQTAKPQESVKVHNLLLTTGHAGNRTA